jgi:hypothetical protein
VLLLLLNIRVVLRYACAGGGIGELGAAREAARRDNPASGGRAIGRIREGPLDYLTRKFIAWGGLKREHRQSSSSRQRRRSAVF